MNKSRMDMIRRIISLLLVLTFVVSDAHHPNDVVDAQSTEQRAPNQSGVLISDYELSLNIDTDKYDTYTLLRERFPYLEPDYDNLVAISDMQLLNMSFVLSILDVLNRQKSTTNILNLATDEVFPDPSLFGCELSDGDHDEHAHDEEGPPHGDLPNVCNSQVTSSSTNVEQYMALAVTLNTLRQQYAKQRLASPDISARSELPTITTLAVNNVAQMVVDKQHLLVQSRTDTDILQNIRTRYAVLVPQSQLVVNQRMSARALTNDEQVKLLNSLQLQFPWALGTEQCITEGGIHAFNPAAKFGTSSFDFLSCDGTEELFTVHAMLDGKPITNLQSTNAGDNRNVLACHNRFITEKKVGDTSVIIAYLHLESTVSLYDSTHPNYISDVKKNDPISKIAKEPAQQNLCAFSSAPHVHISIFINGLEVTANYAGSNGQVSPSWNIGGWRLQFKKVVDASAWRNGWSSFYAGHGNYFNFVNLRDSNITSDQTKTTAKILNMPIQYTPDRNFRLSQSSAETTNGRWPSLKWSYSGAKPVAYYLEVTKQEDTYWLNPAVYECIQPADNWLWFFTQNTSYRPASIDFQTQRTGVFKWRVRVSEVAKTDAQCVEKNRGKWDNWSVEQVFTNRALHNQVPAHRAVGFFQTFRWSNLGSVWAQSSRSMPTVRGYQLKIGRAGSVNPTIVRCSSTPNVTVPLNVMSGISGLHWYTVSALTQSFTASTCASLTGLYESYPRFFDNQIASAKLNPTQPADGHTTTTGLWPQLTWLPPEGSIATYGYRIQVSRVANFASMEVDECVTTPSYVPRDNWWAQARTGTFYWRVNYVPAPWETNQTTCKGLAPNNTTWSTPRTFVNPPSGAAPQLTTPVNTATSLDGLWPTMSWSAGKADLAVNGYRVQVSNLANFSSLIVDECTTGNTYRPTSDSWMRTQNGTYHWRINYVKNAWNGSQSACKSQAVEGGLWSEVRMFTNQQPANPVVHSIPAEGAVSSDGGWPRLEWTNGNFMTAPHGYRIQVSTSNTFSPTNLVVDECTNVTNYQPKDTWWAQAKTGTYYWRVNYVPSVWGTNQSTCKGLTYRIAWSAPRSFTNPVSNKSPQLTAPTQGIVSADGLWPTFTWNAANASFATHGYRIQVSTSSTFSSLLVDECTTGNTYRPASDSWMRTQNGTYHWRINYVKTAWNGAQSACKSQAVESGLWSEVRTFTNQQPANPVVHSSPAEGAVSSDGGWPRLEWTNGNFMTAPHGYRIQVSTSNTFSPTNLVVDECTNVSNYQPKDTWWAQAKTGTYYWRVNYVPSVWGTNQSTCKGLTYRIAWSAPRSFTNPVSNKSPQLTAPTQGIVSADGLWPTFTWNAANASFATHGYRIQVSTSSTFSSLLVDECTTGNTYRPASDSWMRTQNGTYHWRINYVRNAWNGVQTACKSQTPEHGLWSQVRTFVNQQPANPVLRTSPADGSVSSTGGWPRLEWTNGNFMTAPFGYRIQVSTSSSFSNTVVDECTASPSYQPSDFWWSQGQRGGFYWRVNYVPSAWSTNQNTCKSFSYPTRTWSSIGSFSNPTSSRSPISVSPADGHTTSDGLWPTMSWSAFSGSYAVYGYRIQVSTSSNFSSTEVDECTTSTSYRPSSDSWMRERNRTYYWRVNYVKNAWSGSQSSCKSQNPDANFWSGVRRFNNPTPSNPVAIVAPGSGASSGDGGWPRLEWTNGNYMSAPNGYRIQVSTSSSFSSTVVDECTTGRTYQPTDFWWAQSQRGTYYWRVNYVPYSWSSQSGCKSQSYNSSLWGYSVFTNPSSTIRSPGLSSPSNGHTTSDGLWPTFSWSAYSSSYGAYGFRIQISSTNSFSSPAVDECRSSTSYRPSSDSWMRERIGTWYWRVNYCHSSGTDNSLWSATRSFNNPRPKNKVVAQSPGNGHTTSNMLWPTISWSAGSHMTNYYKLGYRVLVWKSTSSGWQNIVDECTTSTSYRPNSDSWMRLHTGTLQWRIFYVEAAWNGSQASCKAQGVAADLGSDSRIFYNPAR